MLNHKGDELKQLIEDNLQKAQMCEDRSNILKPQQVDVLDTSKSSANLHISSLQTRLYTLKSFGKDHTEKELNIGKNCQEIDLGPNSTSKSNSEDCSL